MLKELEVYGFKSFAKRTKLVFPCPEKDQAGITVIVGPNGSGKSNLVEAVQWVLGEQKFKNLRSHQSQDLIFSGSNLRKKADFAEVSIVLENKVNKELWPEIEIKRRLWPNGENEYFLNKKKVRLSDIEETLYKINFGKYSYSLINQGEIYKLLELTPRARKDFFDEATGIKPYLKKIESAQKKIERSQENLEKVEISIKEIHPQLSYLEKQVKKLEKKQQLKQELFKLEKDFYSYQYHQLNKQIISLEEEINKQKNKVKDLKEKIAFNQEKINKLSSSDTSHLWQNLHNEYQEKERLKNNYSKELFILETKIQSLNAPKISTSSVSLNVESSLLLKEIKNFSSQLSSLKERIKSKSISHNSLIKELESLSSKIKKIISFFNEQKQESNEQEQIKNLLEEKKNLESKIKQIDEQIEQISKKLNNIIEEQNKFRQSFSSLEQENQKLRNILEKQETILNDLNIELTKKQTEKQALCQEIQEELGKENFEKIINSNFSETPINSKQDEQKIQRMKRELYAIGEIDPDVEKEYPKVLERYNFLQEQSKDIKQTINSLDKLITHLQEKVKVQFKENFQKINQLFQKYFDLLFQGGKACLEIVNLRNETSSSEEEEEEKKDNIGIEIKTNPPGKKIKSTKSLSGGEKSLTCLALISAIISLNKPPFAIYDEVDAALDEQNSLRLAQILKEVNKSTQLIVVSHNHQTIQAADILYGVTMTKDGSSQVLSVKLNK